MCRSSMKPDRGARPRRRIRLIEPRDEKDDSLWSPLLLVSAEFGQVLEQWRPTRRRNQLGRLMSEPFPSRQQGNYQRTTAVPTGRKPRKCLSCPRLWVELAYQRSKRNRGVTGIPKPGISGLLGHEYCSLGRQSLVAGSRYPCFRSPTESLNRSK